MDKQTVRLSVRELVEFLLRDGSIDNRFGGPDRAAEGARIHRRLQKAAGEPYQAEVSLCMETEYEGILFRIEGRADGIEETDAGILVDEIKTTAAPFELVTEDFSRVHWAQAMCYAHFLCVQRPLTEITVQLTYFQVDTEEIKRFRRHMQAEELAVFYSGLLKKYEQWARMQNDWSMERDASISRLAFPFPTYRKGQREMAAAVYRTICAQGRLFCQAPTGIGKTVSALFPAIKALGEGKAERIFYLTAKTITRQAAEEALARMRGQGLRIKTVTLTAKDKICFLEKRECNPEACPYAAGYYDRINDALLALLPSEQEWTRPIIEACARQYRLCPFELSLDLTLWCDCIVCDYNYLFDPVVALKRFFSDAGGDFIFLIDEAHNLVDRARDMYSATLKKSPVLELRRALGKKEQPLYRGLGRVNTALLELRKSMGEERALVLADAPKDCYPVLSGFCADCEEWMQANREHPMREQVLELFFGVRFFLRIAELYDERYVTQITVHGSDVTVRLLCLDPSHLLDEAMKHGRASALFSATLSPLDYFRAVLSGEDTAKTYALPSPFERERLHLLVNDAVSTKYEDRERSLEPIASLLHTLVQGKRGNYLAYFPSYQYMNDVSHVFAERYPQVETLVQAAGMTEEEREAFLLRFDAENTQTLLGFCVLGGIYAEGIDLKGDRLVGAAVVGVGLPQINSRQEILRDYYNRVNGDGFAFAYRYPGMNKVLQAAGRVIRDTSDRGVVLLIDSRFTSPAYRPLFPLHWQGYRIVRSGEALQKEIAAFWREEEESGI